jgi:hypothetical protein
MRTEKSSRWAAMLLASVVATITCVTVANATQTITTPNAASISYNLTAGTNSAAITPVASKPVVVVGCCTTISGVGQVSLLRSGTSLWWIGLESYNGSPSTITSGANANPGHHIVYIDYNHQVDIQVASASTIYVHNGSVETQAGNVTLIW